MASRCAAPRNRTLAPVLLACTMPAAIFMPVWAATSSHALAPPKTYVVTIENMQFNPSTLTVKRGDRVVWINKDLFAHTVTADTHAFDSRSIAAHASWSYEAAKAGSYAYGCTFHPTMRGALNVQ